jgi:uncharacterized protein (DUF433 family)
MSETDRATVDPAQCGGRPCLRRLRIGVKDVLDLLAVSATLKEILADYPLLEAGLAQCSNALPCRTTT